MEIRFGMHCEQGQELEQKWGQFHVFGIIRQNNQTPFVMVLILSVVSNTSAGWLYHSQSGKRVITHQGSSILWGKSPVWIMSAIPVGGLVIYSSDISALSLCRVGLSLAPSLHTASAAVCSRTRVGWEKRREINTTLQGFKTKKGRVISHNSPF